MFARLPRRPSPILVIAAFGAVATACASAPRSAPTPYTAAEIRGATAAGRTYVWALSDANGPTGEHEVRFETADDAGADLVMTERDVAGAAVGEPARARVTWSELQAHARFDKDAVTVTRATRTVPAGTFACKVYEVRMPDGIVARFFFADDLPGAPVAIETDKDGKRIETQELVRHVPGS